MATRNKNDDNRSSNSNSNSENGRSGAFNWGSAGALAGVAIGGAALAFAANFGRKMIVESMSASAHWAKTLATEHDMVLKAFDKALETDDSQTTQRTMLLTKIAHALDKHAYSEEHVIYPAIRESNSVADAEKLEHEHGEVKEFLYRLKNMEAGDPAWLDTMREFRTSVAAHAKLEEEQIFPQLESEIGEELNKRLTKDLAKASFMMA
jgi:hemerythrin superfamily protein